MADSGDTDAQSSIERSVKPYRGEYPTYDRLPVQGVAREEILRMMEAMRAYHHRSFDVDRFWPVDTRRPPGAVKASGAA